MIGPLRSSRATLTGVAIIAITAVPRTAPAQSQSPDQQPTIIQTWDGRRFDASQLEPADAALSFRSNSSQYTLGWQSVRTIEGPLASRPDIAELLGFGRTVWRATARLDRGDSFGAEPLFEAAFERSRGSVGPTPAAIADGLLRCRLRRNARAAAIDAWLELAANLAVAPARVPNWGLRSPAVDVRTRLVPSLPPIWFEGPAARAFADEPLPPNQSADDPATAIRVLYRAAASHAVGYPINASETARAAEVASSSEGGSLVSLVVMAQIGGKNDRASARTLLAKEQRSGVDAWRSVWASIAIGRSFLQEPGEADHRRGVLELLTVHATAADVSPYLTGVALADAILASRTAGDTKAATIILGDLRRDYPDHPVRLLPGLAPATSPGRSQ